MRAVSADTIASAARIATELLLHPCMSGPSTISSADYTWQRDGMVRLLMRAGVQYVAAPVFGRPDAVLAKKIVNVIAGAKQTFERPC